MPASPLTHQELAEAAQLKRLFADWQRARKSAGKPSSQETAAGMLHFGQSALNQYLNGKIPLNLEAAIKFAKLLDVPISQFSPSMATQAALYGSAVEAHPTALLPGSRRVVAVDDDSAYFVQVPKVKLRLSAGITGFQTEPDERDGRTISVPRQWLDKNAYVPERLVAIKVKGESMEPALYEDDVVIINTADTKPVDGTVFAVNYEGEAVVKRLSRDAGDWWLISDNPDQRKFHRKICRGTECIIVGRVVRKESDRI